MATRRTILMTTGDRDPFTHGGGVVYKTDSGITWEFWFAEDYEQLGEFEVYRATVPDDVSAYYSHDMITEPASSVDMPKSELLAAAQSKDVADRVLVLETIAGYYGPLNLDGYPLRMSMADLKKRWNRSLDAHWGRKSGGKPKARRAKESTGSSMTYQQAFDHLIKQGFHPVPGSSRFEDGKGRVGRIEALPGSGDTWKVDIEGKAKCSCESTPAKGGYCGAVHGECTCTLHKGHKGSHYDSTRDACFKAGSVPPKARSTREGVSEVGVGDDVEVWVPHEQAYRKAKVVGVEDEHNLLVEFPGTPPTGWAKQGRVSTELTRQARENMGTLVVVGVIRAPVKKPAKKASKPRKKPAKKASKRPAKAAAKKPAKPRKKPAKKASKRPAKAAAKKPAKPRKKPAKKASKAATSKPAKKASKARKKPAKKASKRPAKAAAVRKPAKPRTKPAKKASKKAKEG